MMINRFAFYFILLNLESCEGETLIANVLVHIQ